MSNVLRAASSTTRTVFIFAVAAIVLLTSQQIAKAIVTEEVRLDLPIALDGEVWTVEQVGNAVVVGGNFTQVQTSRDGPIVDQVGIYAYDLDSGVFLEDFRPILGSNDGFVEVRDLETNAAGTSVYIGGKFTTIDDQSDGTVRTRNRLALLDISDGRLDRNFAQGGVDAKVLTLEIGPHGWLYVGGNFLTVLDLAPGRPPIEQTVRGLARFDPVTGAFDDTFRIETHGDIGREFAGFRTPGVVKLVVSPDQTRLFIAHRGAEIHNATTGEIFDSPGIARMWIPANGSNPTVSDYKLLFPDADDPIQEFFHIGQCGGRGVQIRDMDVTNDYIVVVSQGADSGYQCDSASRFSADFGDHRPDWVSRGFDSIFSVEIDGDDIYIGGHFRYLVNSSAPSAYPGETVANGASVNDIYQASTSDPDFVNDLINPGYVFPVGQMGVLDAATGYANPTYLPVSDAFKGVLEITAVDRGLLIGQDQSRINGFLVGRSAFFDDDPSAGLPECSVELNEAGNPLVTWTNIGDVNTWNVAANDVFVASVGGTGTEFEDTTQDPGQALEYELRYNRNGLSLVDGCGGVTLDPAAITCTAVLDGEDALISWNDQGWGRVSIFRNGDFVASVSDGLTYSETAPVGDNEYLARGFVGTTSVDAVCGTVTGDPIELTCSASAIDDQATLDWNDAGWNRVSIFRNGNYVSDVVGQNTYTETAPIGDSLYELRGFIDGVRSNAVCSPEITVTPEEAPLATCTATVNGANVVLAWNDVGAASYQIRTNDTWTGEVPAGTTTFTVADDGGTYSLRYRINGEQVNVDCV